MKYRLIAIDLDGTVLDKGGDIIPSAREAIREAMDRNVVVTLATGRMYQPSNRFARELGITAPLICYQGAMIRQPNDGDVLWHKPLPSPLALQVVTEMRRVGLHKYVYIDGEMYVEEIHEKDQWYSERNYVQLNLVEDLAALLAQEPTEVAARGEPEQIDRLVARLDRSLGAAVIVNKVHSAFCEIAHPDSGKGNALKFLAGQLGIRRDQVAAVGDGPNDISMLSWAGLGIVVGDAPDEVKRAADRVIDHGSEDSFAEAIAQLLRDGAD